MPSETSEHISAMVSIMKGASINMLGTASHLALSFGYSFFLARTLVPAEVGRYFIGLTALNFLVIVSIMGLDFTLWRYVSLFMGENKPEKARGVVVSSVLLAFVGSLVVGSIWFLASDILAVKFFHDESLSIVFRFFAVMLPLSVIARVLNASTQGLRKMHYQVLSKDVGEYFARLVLSTAFVIFGLIGILTANIAAAAISAGLAFYFLQRHLPIGRGAPFQAQWRKVAGFSTPLFFSTIFNYGAVWFDTLMLAFFWNSYDVALYSIANRVAIFGVLVLVAFNTMFAPVISDLYNRSERQRLKVLFKFVTRWVVTLSLPIFLLVVMFASPVLSIFGQQYKAASISLIILATGQMINSFTGPVAGMVLMSGHPYLDLTNNLAAFLINVILSILLIGSMGMVGAAIANATAIGTINIVRGVEVYLLMRLHGYNRSFFKTGVAAVISGSIAYVIYLILGVSQIWTLAMMVTVSIIVYVLVLAIMGFEEDDLLMVKMIRERLVTPRSA